MDIAITLALILIALAMLFGKPLNITILHKYDNPPLPDNPEEGLKQQTEENTEAIRTMDAVIKSLHDIMGVNSDDSKY
jgi:hypothetical protein